MKVLIISHNPVTTQNNMGVTFLSLFSCFDRQELCQLYIYPTLPNQNRCASFYRVTDKEILNSLLRFRKPGGIIAGAQIRETEGLFENAEDESFYRSRKNKSPIRRMLRDAMWSLSRWYTRQLRTWLDQQQPDCIFVAPGVAKFLYDIALKIAKERKIPIVTYICDDYYFVREPESWLDRLRLRLLQRKTRQLMEASAALVAICDGLAREYSAHFGVKAHTLMTGAACPMAEGFRGAEQPASVSYFGNIRCNRYLSLAQVGQALDQLNARLGTAYRLKIYTGEKDPQILSAFDGIGAIELCGYVCGEEFDRAFRASQLLLHVEAFDEESIDRVKHSVSTKIADSLAGGVPLLAYGPASVASMEHLIQNRCALTATAPEALEAMLETAFTDVQAGKSAVERALTVAKECHDSDKTSLRLREILSRVI